MHDANKVANRLLELAAANGDTLTPMQLLKLVYICHGWMLGLYGVPLIRDEVQAWKYGPVIPRLYGSVRQFRDQPVVGPLAVRDPIEPFVPHEDQVIQQTYDIYGKKSGPALSRLTHQAGSPWEQTYEEDVMGSVISNDIIEDHYNILARKSVAA